MTTVADAGFLEGGASLERGAPGQMAEPSAGGNKTNRLSLSSIVTTISFWVRACGSRYSKSGFLLSDRGYVRIRDFRALWDILDNLKAGIQVISRVSIRRLFNTLYIFCSVCLFIDTHNTK